MAEIAFTNLLIIVVVAFAAPFLLGLAPSVRLPSVVVEIVAGIVIGPSVLGWVEIDDAVRVLSVIGLAYLLFLAGLEIEFDRLRGSVLRLAFGGWAASLTIAVVVGLGLAAAGAVGSPLFVAIIFATTALGVIIPVLKDSGRSSTVFGQLVITSGTIADFGGVILLSLLFTGEGGPTSTAILLGSLFAMVAAIFVALRGAGRLPGVEATLIRLQDTTAQIRVRAAMVLLIGFVVLAESFGFEAILGAFAAGAVLSLVDGDRRMTHPRFREKLVSMGFGLFIPVFFVSSGVAFDLDALLDDPANLTLVPVFLAALLLVRGLPALLYGGVLDGRQRTAAALLQATSLPFIVAATAIGEDLGVIDAEESSALVAAGLLSVLIFPVAALAVLTGRPMAIMDAPAEDRL
jgi:Kef-type K+ transport system membrane component KefB